MDQVPISLRADDAGTLTHDPWAEHAARFRWLELPMAVLALLVVPALLLDSAASTPEVRSAARATNWVIWVAFCADFLLKLATAPSAVGYVRRAWFDLLLIALSPPFFVPDALQSVRSARALRLLRIVRFLRAGSVALIGLRTLRRLFTHHHFHYVGLVAAATVALGAVGIHVLESGINKGITSFEDAVWWAVVTATTVGYGDVAPVTSEGRIVAVVLMLVGIGVIGVFTATLASYFLERDQGSGNANLEARLARIESKLDALQATVRAPQDGRDPPCHAEGVD